MNKNSTIRSAQVTKNDEFYTQTKDIEKELQYYVKHFNGKIVLCNCNDATHDGFAKYFSANFEKLGLKELICTSFSKDGHGRIYRYYGIKNGNIVPDIDELEQTEMEGNGGFNTIEGIELIKKSDIIVTNPPFSLFREFISILEKYNKKYLIMSNGNAVTYNDIFPLIKDNKMWLGCTLFVGEMPFFRVNNDTDVSKGEYYYDDDGNLYKQVNSIAWFTNLDHNKRHKQIELYKKYNPDEYQKYDNYDAINVGKTKNIPMDYDGVMGVPITFLSKYCPEQFEIVDCRNYTSNDHLKNKPSLLIKDSASAINGKPVYARIAIKRIPNK